MATVKVILEPHKLDREYAQPFTREVKLGDTITFSAVGDDFKINIPNADNFLLLVGGSSAGDPVVKTITSGNSESFEVTTTSPTIPYKYYNVCWIDQKIDADRPGNSPPRIIAIP